MTIHGTGTGQPAIDEVVRDRAVRVPIGRGSLPGWLTLPTRALGVVIFAPEGGAGRQSSGQGEIAGHLEVAVQLHRAGIGTLLLRDLLTSREAAQRGDAVDVRLLGSRLTGATAWLRRQPGLARIPVGWFGSGTGAAAALWAAAEPGSDTAAIVTRSGHPCLAGSRLGFVRAPALLIVGELDPVVLRLNAWALERLGGGAQLTVVPGATHRFEEPGAADQVARAATGWFGTHLAGTAPTAAPHRTGSPQGQSL